MQEYEDEGISLGQIFKVIFRRWKLLLFITGIIFVFGLLGSQLIYNRLKTNYTTTVVYNVDGINNGTYSDGSAFNYRDLVKLENLEKVKADGENGKYSSIDVKTLVEKEKISVERKVEQDETKTVNTIVFTITAQAKYFKNSDQAKDFLYDVMLQPVVKTINIEKEANRKANLDSFNQSPYFANQISYLKNQLSYINSTYDRLISQFGDNQTVLTKKLSEYKQELNSWFEKNPFSVLDNELTAKKYVKNFSSIEQELIIRKESLTKQISDNQNIIDSLYAQMKKLNNDQDFNLKDIQSTDVFTPYTSQLASLTISNAQMSNELTDINKQLDENGGNPDDIVAFTNKLNTYYNKLDQATDEVKDISVKVVSEDSTMDYTGKSIDAKGGLSLIISILLFLVGGFVVAAIVNLILDRKYLKEDPALVTTNNQVVGNKPADKEEVETKEE